MLKHSILAIVCTAVFTSACLSSAEEEDALGDEVTSTDSSALEWNPVPICPDLLHQRFESPHSCVKNGQLGIKQCYQYCDLYRSAQLDWTSPPPHSWTCRIDSAECGPLICGPCEVFEPQGPLP